MQSKSLDINTNDSTQSLKLKIKNLELEVSLLTTEKIELEKLLNDFQHQHTVSLGELILQILNLKKLSAKSDSEEYKEAEKDENQYRYQLNFEREKKIYFLDEKQKIELKKNFRKATLLCHPDKMDDEFKDLAKQVFIDLKQAYDINDLQKVNEILYNLEQGAWFKSIIEIRSEFDVLNTVLSNLIAKAKILKDEIESIRASETYNLILSINNWDEYFSNLKFKLERELVELKAHVNHIQNSSL